LSNAPQRLQVVVAGGRISVLGRDGVRVAFSSVVFARGGRKLLLPALASARSHANEVQFAAPGVRESLTNGPLGVEQTFVLDKRPPGAAPLRITQTISGNAAAHAAPNGDGVTFSSGRGVLRYEGLVVTDATGARIPARLGVAAHRMTIVINDNRAVYPLRVDPEFAQAAELTASGGGAGDNLGYSVAVSGSTIVAGAINATVGSTVDQGAVYVYRLPAAGGWADATQTAELTASDGVDGDNLGFSVAVDGSTIIASAPNSSQGGLYVWTMPTGGWSGTPASPLHQTAELAASNFSQGDSFGYSVALSGATIVAGAPVQSVASHTGQGATYVWTMPDGGWSGTPGNPLLQTAELTASDGAASEFLGYSVGVSGATIVAGADLASVNSDNYQGAAYVWTRPASGGWVDATQTAKLTASDGGANDQLGVAVAVSGPTVVAGALGHNGYGGAVYEWTMPDGGWSGTPGNPLQQTAELAASDGSGGDYLGGAVAVAGSTIVAGAVGHTVAGNYSAGAAYVWVMPSGGWTGTPGSPLEETAELTADDGAPANMLGNSVALSGSTVVAGAGNHMVGVNAQQGAAYAFHPVVNAATASLALSPASIAPDGSSTTTATFTVGDTSGNPVFGDAVSITSSGAQSIGPVTEGATPGTYMATITASRTTGPATITATDLTASPNAGATATLSQGTAATGPGSLPTSAGSTGTTGSPSNGFTAAGRYRNVHGTVVLTLDLPGAGSVFVLGTHSDPVGDAGTAGLLPAPGYHRLAWATRRRTVVGRAGPMRVTLRPNRAGAQMLRYARRQGWALHVRVWITFIPTGGVARNREVTVRVLNARTV
jgi:hypothetical protein